MNNRHRASPSTTRSASPTAESSRPQLEQDARKSFAGGSEFDPRPLQAGREVGLGGKSAAGRSQPAAQDTNERLSRRGRAGEPSARADSNQATGRRATPASRPSRTGESAPQSGWEPNQVRGEGRSQSSEIRLKGTASNTAQENAREVGADTARHGARGSARFAAAEKMRSREYGDNNRDSSATRARKAS